MESAGAISVDEVEDLLSDPMGGAEPDAPLPSVQIPHVLTAVGGCYERAFSDMANGFDLLSAEDEYALATAWHLHQDREAGAALVCAHLRLAVRYAKTHAGQVEVMDLIQEGTIGLLKALQRFDPTRGIRFSSYAKFWIKESICRYLLTNVRLVELGGTRAGRTLFYQLSKTRAELIGEGLTPTPERVAERLEVPTSEVVAVAARLDSKATSLSAPVGSEQRKVRDVLPDDGASPDSSVDCERAAHHIAQDLAHFATTLRGHIERHVWSLRLCSSSPLTISDLAERLRVRPAEVQASEDDLRGRLAVWVTG